LSLHSVLVGYSEYPACRTDLHRADFQHLCGGVRRLHGRSAWPVHPIPTQPNFREASSSSFVRPRSMHGTSFPKTNRHSVSINLVVPSVGIIVKTRCCAICRSDARSAQGDFSVYSISREAGANGAIGSPRPVLECDKKDQLFDQQGADSS